MKKTNTSSHINCTACKTKHTMLWRSKSSNRTKVSGMLGCYIAWKQGMLKKMGKAQDKVAMCKQFSNLKFSVLKIH